MWRSVAALLLLLAAPRCHASVFSEAGGSRAEAPSLEELEAPVVTAEDDSEAFQSGGEYPTSEDLEQAAKEFLAAHYDETREEISDADLEKIVDELTRQEQERAEREPPLFEQQTVPVAEEQPKEAPAPAPQAAEKVEAEVAPSVEPEEEKKPLVAQKKGQNEFVSFVEPAPARQLKSGQSLDKRRPVESTHSRNNHQASHDMNLFFVAVGTVLVVGTVGGVVGGGLYFMRRRETPDDGEFAPYAGTGPGSKRGLKAGGPKGDESLAYKAQLHHYQQAKQKIICGDDGTGVNLGGESEESGAEDADEEENNFSVYECPGLAPTGDIEVHNPNFAPDH